MSIVIKNHRLTDFSSRNSSQRWKIDEVTFLVLRIIWLEKLVKRKNETTFRLSIFHFVFSRGSINFEIYLPHRNVWQMIPMKQILSKLIDRMIDRRLFGNFFKFKTKRTCHRPENFIFEYFRCFSISLKFELFSFVFISKEWWKNQLFFVSFSVYKTRRRLSRISNGFVFSIRQTFRSFINFVFRLVRKSNRTNDFLDNLRCFSVIRYRLTKLSLTINTKVRFSFFVFVFGIRSFSSRQIQSLSTDHHTGKHSIVFSCRSTFGSRSFTNESNSTELDFERNFLFERTRRLHQVRWISKKNCHSKSLIWFFRILNRTSVIGTFLIRPQSKRSSSSDHDYVRLNEKTERKKNENICF